MKKLLGTLLIIAAPAMAYGNPMVNLHKNVSVSEGAFYQHYREHVNNQTLDKETGWMPVFNASASYISPNRYLFLKGSIQYTEGNTNYTSLYTTSHTGNQIVSGDIEAGKGFLITNRFMVTPFVSYGHRFWQRKLSYTENYNLNYIGAGINADYQVSPRLIVSAQGFGGSTFDNTLNTPATHVTYNLGNKPIVKASLKANYQIMNHWSIFSSLNYNYFRFGKSQINTRYDTYEPNSTTQEASVDFGIRYLY